MSSRIEFIKTPAAPAQPKSSIETGVRTTDYPAIKNGSLVAEGPSSKHFSNTVLFGLILGLPLYCTWKLGGGFKLYLLFVLIWFFPLLISYWWVMSGYSPRLNDKCKLPNRGVEHYLEFHDEDLAKKYRGQNKIPMVTFHDLYFEGKVSFKGDCLEVMEYRHDWATFQFTTALFKYFLTSFIPEVILHSRSQDEEQVRDHYDRGDDFYAWFLGPRMIYTSGVISDIHREESLEELQDNKLRVVAEKIGLKSGDRLLDLGCGWGTLARYASTQYGAHVTGITLGKNQTAWGNTNLSREGASCENSKILCLDYRDTPLADNNTRKYDKITCLEMAEHVGVRKLQAFFRQVYDMLEDDGVFYLQYAGLRKAWQYEDLVWGLFMSKYIFPGADASTPLGFVTDQLEAAGFEIVNVDNIGVHYSATLWRWYRNWLGNKDKVVSKYGIKWYRIWEYFLASSTIVSRQGSAICYQIVLRKALNSYPRIEDVDRQYGLQVPKPAGGNAWLNE